jgi:hypothetical protein
MTTEIRTKKAKRIKTVEEIKSQDWIEYAEAIRIATVSKPYLLSLVRAGVVHSFKPAGDNRNKRLYKCKDFCQFLDQNVEQYQDGILVVK